MITCMAASLIGRPVILVVMFIKTFKTNVIVAMGNITICLTSHLTIIFSSLVLIISLCVIKEKMSNIPKMKANIQCTKHVCIHD